MTLAQTNRLCLTAGWSSYAATTSASAGGQLDESEEDPRIPSASPRPIAVVVLDPTVQGARPPREAQGGAVFAYDVGQAGQRAYRIISLEGTEPVLQPQPEEDDVPVFSFPPVARKVIRAKVHLRRGRFSLIVPDALLDGEEE